MKKWLRRLGYLAAVLVWLGVMSLPVVAFLLATQRQIQLGEGPRSYIRLFLVQERDAQGVGLEWVRPSGERVGCSEGTLLYLMWEGQGQSGRFCQCYHPVSMELSSTSPAACAGS